MKNIISLIVTIIISFPMMSQDKLIQIDKSSYYKDSKNVYFVVTNYLSNAPFFSPSSRSEIPLAAIKNNGKLVYLGSFNELGIIVTAEEFEKKYRMSGSRLNGTFAVKLLGVTIEPLKDFKLLNKHYVSIGNKVFLHYNELKGVDTATFQLIDTGYSDIDFFYSKDKNSVYYFSDKIAESDVLSFKVINGVYSKDKNSAYYHGDKIKGVDVLSFKMIDRDYSKDKNQVFFEGVALNNADPKSFNVWGNYQIDANHVWFDGKLLDDIDRETLIVLDKCIRLSNPSVFLSDYAIDKNSVFYQGNQMLKVNPKIFRVIHSCSKSIAAIYGIDNTYVYSEGKIIKNANPKSFRIIGNYLIDTNHVWFKGKLLDDIDIKTFKVLDRPVFYSMPEGDYTDYAIDKNFVFYQGNRMLKADPKTFKIIINYSRPLAYAIDNTHVYYAGKIVKNADPKTFLQTIKEK